MTFETSDQRNKETWPDQKRNFWQFLTLLTILKNFTAFDNFEKFWPFLTILTILEKKLQFWHLRKISWQFLQSRQFLSDPGIPGVRSMGPSVSNKLTKPPSDTSYTSYTRLYTEKVTVSTLENSSWWSQLMQVVPSGGQICNQCKWRHLVAKFGTNASGAIWWPNLQLMQVAPSGGQFCN